MKIGILGTGVVGSTIGTRLVELGHEVMMGSRTYNNEKAVTWISQAGKNRKGTDGAASQGTFADAARHGEFVINCTKGEKSVEVIRMAGEENLSGKILIDLANPLDFSKGFPPTLTICNTDSLGEQIQKAVPSVKVVKALNTMTCSVMVNPASVPGVHTVFMCGNDQEAKDKVEEILRAWFGWQQVIDLGDITNARGTEMMLPIWVRLYAKFQTANFNFHIAK